MPGYNPNAFSWSHIIWNHYCTRWHIFGFYFFLNLPVWVCLVVFCKHYCAEKSVKVLFWQSNGIILLLAGYSHTGRTKLNFQGAHLVPGHGQCFCCSRFIMGTAVLPIYILDPQTSNWSQSFHKGPWRPNISHDRSEVCSCRVPRWACQIFLLSAWWYQCCASWLGIWNTLCHFFKVLPASSYLAGLYLKVCAKHSRAILCKKSPAVLFLKGAVVFIGEWEFSLRDNTSACAVWYRPIYPVPETLVWCI